MSNEEQVTTATKAHFNPRTFLSTIGKGREMVSFGKKSTIFAQGDTTDGLFFIQEGKVQLSVVSEAGKEATLGILSEGDFFGEGGLAGQLTRMSCAIALTDCVLLHVERKAMMHAMNMQPKLSALFMKCLLKRNIRIPGRLGRSTLQLQRKAACTSSSVDGALRQGRRFRNVSAKNLSQETLAEMVGTTRSRVCFFMNRFRKLGFINYDVGNNLHVHSSLLNIVLHDDDGESATSPARNHSARQKRVSEPPPEHGRLRDGDRAKRPTLPGVQGART